MTLMRTHNVVNLGAVAALLGAGMNQPFILVTIAQLAAILTDKVIDLAGHAQSSRPRIMRRTPVTHSVVTAPAWAVLVGVLVTYATNLLPRQMNTTFLHIPFLTLPADTATPIILACLLAAATHLLLDSLTEAGIYVPNLPRLDGDKRIFRRWRIAGIQHDSALLNTPLILLGLGTYGVYLLYGNPRIADMLAAIPR